MTKRLYTLLGLSALIAVLSGAALSPSFADSAPAAPRHSFVAVTPDSGVAPRSCQAPNAQALLFLANGNILGYDCTGSVFPNVSAIRFDAGGWSGHIHWNGQSRKFCDWQSLLGSGTVTEIDFSPTKLSGC